MAAPTPDRKLNGIESFYSLDRLAISAPIDLGVAGVADLGASRETKVIILEARRVTVEEGEICAGIVARRKVVEPAAWTGKVISRSRPVIRRLLRVRPPIRQHHKGR